MEPLAAGPFDRLDDDDGTEMPLYVMPFDEDGRCSAPETREHLMRFAAEGDPTDTFLFSHGWNNTWPVALDRYESFARGFMAQRREYSIPHPSRYRPLLVGVYWPSASLVPADEAAPDMAAGGGEVTDQIAALANAIDPAQRERLSMLLDKDDLDETAMLELATILQPIYAPGRDELPDDEPIRPEDVVAMWLAGIADDPGTVDEEAAIAALKQPGSLARPGGLQAAGKVGVRGRDVVRLATIWRMKDRAASVGGSGVSALLADLMDSAPSRVHLVGHSLGAKVMLSAVVRLRSDHRHVTSMLLLQPAVSHLCFATELPKGRGSGGYAQVPERVDLAIATTHSRNDFPLNRTFHLALRRRRDLGEQKIAAPGSPPSIHAALGGYGPRGREDITSYVDVKLPTEPYDLDPAIRILSIDATAEISGHGEVSNQATWWMLHNLVLAGARR